MQLPSSLLLPCPLTAFCIAKLSPDQPQISKFISETASSLMKANSDCSVKLSQNWNIHWTRFPLHQMRKEMQLASKYLIYISLSDSEKETGRTIYYVKKCSLRIVCRVSHLCSTLNEWHETTFQKSISDTESGMTYASFYFLGDARDSIPWIRVACLMSELPSLLECDTKKSLPEQWQQRKVHRAMSCTAALAAGLAGVMEFSWNRAPTAWPSSEFCCAGSWALLCAQPAACP